MLRPILFLTAFLTATACGAQSADKTQEGRKPSPEPIRLTFEDAKSRQYVRSSVGQLLPHVREDTKGRSLEWLIKPDGLRRFMSYRAWLAIYTAPEDLDAYAAVQLTLRSDSARTQPLTISIAYSETQERRSIRLWRLPTGRWTTIRVPFDFLPPAGAKSRKARPILLIQNSFHSDGFRLLIDDVIWEKRAGPLPSKRVSPTLDPADSEVLARLWAGPVGSVQVDDGAGTKALSWRFDMLLDRKGLVGGRGLRVRGFPSDLRPYRAVRLVIGVDPPAEEDVGCIELWKPGATEFPLYRLQLPRLESAVSTIEVPIRDRGFPDAMAPNTTGSTELHLCFNALELVNGCSPNRLEGRVTLRRIELVEGARGGASWTPKLQARIDALAAKGASGITGLAAILDEHPGKEGAVARLAAVNGLSRMGAPASARLLAVLESDESEEVAKAAGGALVAMGSALEPLVSELVDTIAAEESSRRGELAAAVLAAAGPPGRAALFDLFGHPLSRVRWLASRTVLEMKPLPDGAVDRWKNLIAESEDADTVRDAAEALIQVKPAGETLLRSFLESPRPETRAAAFRVLLRNDVLPDADAKLAGMPGDDRLELVKSILSAHYESAPAIRALFLCLDDEDLATRRGAFDLIVEIPDRIRADLPRFTRLLRDSDPEIRRATAEALGKTEGTEVVVQALTAALEDESMHVAEAAAIALQALVKDAAEEIPSLAAFYESDRWKAHLDAYAMHLLTILRGEKITSAGFATPDNMRECMQKYLDLAAYKALPGLKALAHTDRDPKVTAFAIEALASFDDPKMIPSLRPFLEHEMPRVRIAASWALDRLLDDNPEPRWQGLFDDPDMNVRHAATQLARRHRAKTTAPDLVRLIARKEIEVDTFGALMALTHCGDKRHAPAVAAFLERKEVERTGMQLMTLTVLAQLDAAGYRKKLRTYLDPTGRVRGNEMRRAAAVGLARVQDPDAKMVLATEGPTLMLNYYRGPSIMKRLEETRVHRRDVRGIPLEKLLPILARRSGVRIEVDESAPASWREAVFDRMALRFSCLDVLHSLKPDQLSRKVQLFPVTENDRVRLLPVAKAQAVFKQYAQECQKAADEKPAR